MFAVSAVAILGQNHAALPLATLKLRTVASACGSAAHAFRMRVSCRGFRRCVRCSPLLLQSIA